MTYPLNDAALDQLFRAARTHQSWRPEPLSEQLIRDLYDLLKWGPTSFNSTPARFVWVRSPDGKARLASLAAASNGPKILAAPVTVIVGYDLDFAECLPELLPARGQKIKPMFNDPALRQATAFRNSSLQGAYLILAARSLGLDCGPMSGFDNDGVDRAFFAGTNLKSNFICSLGHGEPESVHPRAPRLEFGRACRFA